MENDGEKQKEQLRLMFLQKKYIDHMKRCLTEHPPQDEQSRSIVGRITQLIRRWEWGVYHGHYSITCSSYVQMLTLVKGLLIKHAGLATTETKWDIEEEMKRGSDDKDIIPTS